MTQSSAEHLYQRGTIDLEPRYPARAVRWVVRDPQGVVLGTVPLPTKFPGDTYAQALALLGLTRPYQLNRALVSLGAREVWDHGDPRGSAMIVIGVLCDVAQVLGAGERIDERAGYRPSAGLRTVDDLDMSVETGDPFIGDLLVDIENGVVSLDDVVLAVRAVARYIDLLEATPA